MKFADKYRYRQLPYIQLQNIKLDDVDCVVVFREKLVDTKGRKVKYMGEEYRLTFLGDNVRENAQTKRAVNISGYIEKGVVLVFKVSPYILKKSLVKQAIWRVT